MAWAASKDDHKGVGMSNQDFMDAISLASFIIGLANYNENLTQNDKAEIMDKLDRQTRDILIKLQAEIETQNEMLKEILRRLPDETDN